MEARWRWLEVTWCGRSPRGNWPPTFSRRNALNKRRDLFDVVIPKRLDAEVTKGRRQSGQVELLVIGDHPANEITRYDGLRIDGRAIVFWPVLVKVVRHATDHSHFIVCAFRRMWLSNEGVQFRTLRNTIGRV